VENREIGEAICRMASDFYRLRNRSLLDLLKSSGYVQDHDTIREQQLQIVFEADPELIRPWSILSEDQRTNTDITCCRLVSRRTKALTGWLAITLVGKKSTFLTDLQPVPDLSNLKLKTCAT
jgi:hypothetical protein